MKKLLFLAFGLVISLSAMAQKYAVIDTEYILNKMPRYRTAQEQVTKATALYQSEVDNAFKQVDEMYRAYHAERSMLTDELRRKREDNIIEKEKEAKELQRSHFGPEGTLFKKNEELLKPIQDQMYAAIKDLATEGGYAVIFDSANNPSIIYIHSRYDKSDEVLKKLGL